MTPLVRTIEPVDLVQLATEEALQVAIVVSRYNEWITCNLREGAVAAFERRLGGTESTVTIIEAPGAFELPLLVSEAIQSGAFHAVVALGCVIKGETSHDQHINHSVSSTLAHIAADHGVPVGFGLLTVESAKQAEARAGGAMGNKGAEAMDAALDTLAMLEALALVEGDQANDEDDDDEELE
ncbi:MAG: 6,7-dimethyl-8-ribityllumazine synthase [Phycisphaerales bacterium]|nr:6,7-dimethyl-8-ribityllumazine synthase [Phycisphaerales bacterium]